MCLAPHKLAALVLDKALPEHRQHDDRLLDLLQALQRLRVPGLVHEDQVVVGQRHVPLPSAGVRPGPGHIQYEIVYNKEVKMVLVTVHAEEWVPDQLTTHSY